MPFHPADRERPSRAAAVPPRPPVSLEAGRLRVVFTWAGDRWGHAIEVDGGLLASSLEHTAEGCEPEWPASPPLVELSTTTAPAGTAILAVGRAGRNHYSASVTPHPAEPDTLLVELACRISQPPRWLGSTYAIAGRVARIVAAPAEDGLPATVRWSYMVGPTGLRALAPARTAGGD